MNNDISLIPLPEDVMDLDSVYPGTTLTYQVRAYGAACAAAAVQAEREACAKACESLVDLEDNTCDEAERCAAAIRARKGT